MIGCQPVGSVAQDAGLTKPDPSAPPCSWYGGPAGDIVNGVVRARVMVNGVVTAIDPARPGSARG